MRAAAKTMVKLLGGANGKARQFFIMKRATRRIIGTCFFKRHTFVDNINNINTVKQILNEAIWNQNGFFTLQLKVKILS